MARYFAGNTLAAFSRNSLAVFEDTSRPAAFDSAFVDRCMTINNSLGVMTSTTFSAAGTLWLRMDMYWTSDPSTTIGYLTVLNAGVGVFRLMTSQGNSTLQAQYWNGTTWVNTGTTFAFSPAIRNTLVVRIDLNSGFTAYVAGAQVMTGSGWTGGQTAATYVEFRGIGGSRENQLSQIMGADYDLRDSHFATRALNGNSAVNTGGSGAYTDVMPPLNDGTAVRVTVAGNKMGQTKAALTVPAGYFIGAMVISGRGRVSGTITNAKLGIRTAGGVNNSGSNLGYNSGYEPRQRIIENDPDTATSFTQTGFNNAEIYEEAA